MMYDATMRQRAYFTHKRPRHPLEANWVTPCNIMASGTGMSASRTPIRIMPPAIPKIPDRNDVPIMSGHRISTRNEIMAPCKSSVPLSRP